MPRYRLRNRRPVPTVINVPDTYSYGTWNGSGFPADPGANPDLSQDLEAWLASQPAGTENAPVVVRFPYRKVFHIQRAVTSIGKHWWTVDYNECAFVRDKELWGDRAFVPKVNTIPGWEEDNGPPRLQNPGWEFYVGDAFFEWHYADHQRHIGNGVLVRGSNRLPPESDLVITNLSGWEGRGWTDHTEGVHGWRWLGCRDVYGENMNARNLWGDGFLLGGESVANRVEYFHLKDCLAHNVGRQLVTVGTCYDLLCDNIDVDRGWAVCFDPEVNGDYDTQITDIWGTPRRVQGCTKVEIRNSTMRSRSGCLSNGSEGILDLYFHHNTVIFTNPSRGGAIIDNGPVSGIRIEDNVFQTQMDAWAIVLSNASGYNSFRRNTLTGNYANAVWLGQPNRPVSGTFACDGNDMPGYTNLYRDENVSNLVKSPNCGNRITAGGAFNVPVACS